MSIYNFTDNRPNKLQPYISWKGSIDPNKTTTSIVAANSRPLTKGDTSENPMNRKANPIKHWRKQLMPRDGSGHGKVSVGLAIDRPGGSHLVKNSCSLLQKPCSDTIKNYIEDTDSRSLIPNCSKKICNKQRITRSASTIISKSYYTTNKEYLRKRVRLYDQNQLLSPKAGNEYLDNTTDSATLLPPSDSINGSQVYNSTNCYDGSCCKANILETIEVYDTSYVPIFNDGQYSFDISGPSVTIPDASGQYSLALDLSSTTLDCTDASSIGIYLFRYDASGVDLSSNILDISNNNIIIERDVSGYPFNYAIYSPTGITEVSNNYIIDGSWNEGVGDLSGSVSLSYKLEIPHTEESILPCGINCEGCGGGKNPSHVIYKPNNPSFSKQGAVSSSLRLQKIKYNAVTKSAKNLDNPWGQGASNNSRYRGGIEAPYINKSKFDLPIRKLKNRTISGRQPSGGVGRHNICCGMDTVPNSSLVRKSGSILQSIRGTGTGLLIPKQDATLCDPNGYTNNNNNILNKNRFLRNSKGCLPLKDKCKKWCVIPSISEIKRVQLVGRLGFRN